MEDKEDSDVRRIGLAVLLSLVWGLLLFGFVIWAFVFKNAAGFFAPVFKTAFLGQDVTAASFTPEVIRTELLSFLAVEMLVAFAAIALIIVLTKRLSVLNPPLLWLLTRRSPRFNLLDQPWLRFQYLLLAFTLVEETVFRWFPLAVYAQPFPDIPQARAAFILAASFAFAFVHLGNFAPKDRRLITVFPHFISGLFFAYAFLHWGFGGAVFVHYCHNFFLMSGTKVVRDLLPKHLVKEVQA